MDSTTLIKTEAKVADNISKAMRGLTVEFVSLILFRKSNMYISQPKIIFITIIGIYEKIPIIKESKIKKLNSFFTGNVKNKSMIFLPINPGNNRKSK